MKTLNLCSLLLTLLLALATTPLRAEEAKGDAPKPDADGWYTIFNGKDLTGWKKSDDHPESFKVVDGEIVAHGETCHLFYDGPVNNANFKNFEWKADV